MTPESQRIAIAEACGWRQCQWNGAYGTLKGVPPVRPSAFQDIPNYLSDLNAMHEAEKVIKAPHIYNEQLEMVVLGYPLRGKDSVANFMLRCATAAQRAEAFLRCLNLWT